MYIKLHRHERFCIEAITNTTAPSHLLIDHSFAYSHTLSVSFDISFPLFSVLFFPGWVFTEDGFLLSTVSGVQILSTSMCSVLSKLYVMIKLANLIPQKTCCLHILQVSNVMFKFKPLCIYHHYLR